MCAPKTPVSTVDAERAQRGAEALVERLGDARAARRRVKRRAVALRGVGDQRELGDDERRAARVEQRAVELALVVLRRCAAARPSRRAARSRPRRPRLRRRASTTRPGPIAPPGRRPTRADDAADDDAHLRLTRAPGCATAYVSEPASSSSRACSGRSPPPSCPASRARGRARSARSGRSARALRRSSRNSRSASCQRARRK